MFLNKGFQLIEQGDGVDWSLWFWDKLMINVSVLVGDLEGKFVLVEIDSNSTNFA